MRMRRYDVLFVLAAVALAGWWLYGSSGKQRPEGGVDFTLNEVSGGPLRLADVEGPVLITLTSLGCEPCRGRVNGVDREAATLASHRGVKVWNIIVYADKTSAANWVAEYAPSSHAVLLDDPGARVGVQMLGGNDSACYILLDKDHRKVWQGPADSRQLTAALDALGLPAAGSSEAGQGAVTGSTALTPHLDPPPGRPEGD